MAPRLPELDVPAGRYARAFLPGALAGALAILCLVVLRPFFAPILWAAILAYATWPLYRLVRRPFRRSGAIPAALMVVLVVSVAVLPFLWLLALIRHELADALRALDTLRTQNSSTLTSALRAVPWLDSLVHEGLKPYTSDPQALGREVLVAVQRWSGELIGFVGAVGRNLGKLLIALLTLFFFYRDGDRLILQAAALRSRFLGDRADASLRAAGQITRLVLYGFLLTALAQGSIAGLGYWIFGAHAPVLLGALTGVMSFVPLVGTSAVWVPLGAWLILSGHLWRGVLLLLWCFLLVHPTDNLLRPLLVSNVAQVPFLLIMLGMLGGLLAFGFVGVVIGPVVLGVAAMLWGRLAAERAEAD